MSVASSVRCRKICSALVVDRPVLIVIIRPADSPLQFAPGPLLGRLLGLIHLGCRESEATDLMLRPYNVLFLALLVLAAIAVRAGTSPARSGVSAPRLSVQAVRQPESLRIDGLTSTGRDVQMGGPAQITGPLRIDVAPDGHVFVIDDGSDEEIREYAEDGRLVHRFATEGAPQMQSVSDLTISSQKVWVTDLLASAVHVFDRSSVEWTTLKLKEEPYRLETADDTGNNLLVMRIGADLLFDLTDEHGTILRSFGTLLLDQPFHALALDGFIARAGSSLIYSGKHLGIVASFSTTGELNWLANAVGSPELPVIRSTEDRRWVEHGPIRASEGITGADNVICVLARRADGARIRAYIDLYRHTDGVYQRSLLLPDSGEWTSVSVGGGFLYAAHRSGLFRWPLAVLATTNASLLSAGQPFLSLSPSGEQQ